MVLTVLNLRYNLSEKDENSAVIEMELLVFCFYYSFNKLNLISLLLAPHKQFSLVLFHFYLYYGIASCQDVFVHSSSTFFFCQMSISAYYNRFVCSSFCAVIFLYFIMLPFRNNYVSDSEATT